MPKILNLTVKRTNCYLLEGNCGWLLVDTDFPDTFHRFMGMLKQHGLKVSDINYFFVTHFHPDHAGFVQDLKKEHAQIRCLTEEDILPFIKLCGDIDRETSFMLFEADERANYHENLQHSLRATIQDDRSCIWVVENDNHELVGYLMASGNKLHRTKHKI